MKKLIITSACVLATAGAVFAQGNVNWNSVPFGSYTSATNSTQYSPLMGGGATGGGTSGSTQGSASLGTGYYYELLVGSAWNGSVESSPTSLAALGGWTDSGLEASNSAAAGRVTVINGNAGATVAAISQTVSNSIMLVGWSADLGGSWAVAYSNLNNTAYLVALKTAGETAFLGISSVGAIEGLGTSTSPGAGLFGPSATTAGIPIQSTGTQLFEVPVVPEPATMALAALGGASLLLFRRKNRK